MDVFRARLRPCVVEVRVCVDMELERDIEGINTLKLDVCTPISHPNSTRYFCVNDYRLVYINQTKTVRL